MTSQYQLSVLLVTYNHEIYIERALKSLFAQNIQGPIELVIADDASSDATMGIIRSFEGRDERFNFNYLESTANCGITKNYQRSFAACSGEYVAVLEGDDYWVSPHKLKRQLDFLVNHLECDLCSVNYFVFQQDRAQFTIRFPAGTGYRYLDARDLISDNLVGNFSTCMYRKSALEFLPKTLFDIISYDWIINICVSRVSLIGFLEEPMSVYRLHSSGVWSKTAHVDKLVTQLNMIPAYDVLTDNVFSIEFSLLADRLNQEILLSTVGDRVGRSAVSILKRIPRFVDFIPPFCIFILRGIIPPAAKRIFHRLIRRG